MNISSRIDQFVAHLQPTTAQLTQAKKQTDVLVECLKDRVARDGTLILERVFASGSNAKHTSLMKTHASAFDIDLGFYYSGRSARQEKRDLLLDFTREQLCRIYPNKDRNDFSIGKHAVHVTFRTQKLNVDVVPIIREDRASRTIANGG
jgi:tRNA nucleotidyltransferase (CCA-adding enzyme)